MTTELTERVRSGDLEPFGELFELHRKRACQLARRFSSYRSDEDELVSRAFEKILLALLNGNGPNDEAFRAYLYVVLRNEATNLANLELRKQAVVTKLSAQPPEHEAWEDAISRLEDRPLIAAATGAYRRLPPRYRLILRLTTVENLSRPVVCELLGLKSNAVDALAYRARKELRRVFARERRRSFEDRIAVMNGESPVSIPRQARHGAAGGFTPAPLMAESTGRSGPP